MDPRFLLLLYISHPIWTGHIDDAACRFRLHAAECLFSACPAASLPPAFSQKPLSSHFFVKINNGITAQPFTKPILQITHGLPFLFTPSATLAAFHCLTSCPAMPFFALPFHYTLPPFHSLANNNTFPAITFSFTSSQNTLPLRE